MCLVANVVGGGMVSVYGQTAWLGVQQAPAAPANISGS
jgi:hypothetical protein